MTDLSWWIEQGFIEPDEILDLTEEQKLALLARLTDKYEIAYEEKKEDGGN